MVVQICYFHIVMNPEAIFSIIFTFVILAIPFALGLGLTKALRKRKDIEFLFSESKYATGRIVGYTKRKYDTENIGDYYPIIEYMSGDGQRLWAEGQSCDKNKYAVNSKIKLMFHPQDRRYVMLSPTQGLIKARAGFEKNLELSINLIFTVLMVASFVHYIGYAPYIFMVLSLSYLVGIIFGIILNKRKADKPTKVLHSPDRDRRLIAAQNRGQIPSYLKEFAL